MIRIILAATAMIFAIALAVPESQACISCEYKPEVLGASEHSPRVQKRVRVDAVVKARKSRASKEHVATRKASGKRPMQAEKAPSTDEKTIKSSEEKTTNATTEAASETATPRAQSVYNTLLKTTEPASAPAAATPPATAPAATVNEPPAASAKPVATAESAPATAVSEETSEAVPTAASTSETVTVSQQKGDKATGCKKFFPMADITLTVDCK